LILSLANLAMQDEHRLPEGFERVGYDADTERYTFIERTTGKYYESAPGNRYGLLTPLGSRPRPEVVEQNNAELERGNKQAIRLMLPFALLVLVFLFLLFRFLYGGADDNVPQVQCDEGYHKIQIKKGETCWAVAQAHGLGVEDLLELGGNEDVDCDMLKVGQQMCVPL
jgi:hypothetical protein